VVDDCVEETPRTLGLVVDLGKVAKVSSSPKMLEERCQWSSHDQDCRVLPIGSQEQWNHHDPSRGEVATSAAARVHGRPVEVSYFLLLNVDSCRHCL
jgi:hypothetical protein